ncbi:TlpA family protein disulfide reductase [bacterium]|jgi:peroxiredoxin|nr:TlpA family protein disulfide reductase [bacterium]|tara:strand:- start:261 stop:782 length:522 start_codon:yes stop_codon:yes gene_type:complete
MKIKLILSVAALIIFAVTVFSFFVSSQDLDEVPNISLNIIDGRKIKIDSMKGKPLLVTFWSTTCSTCIKEMPHLVELYNQFNKDGLEIIGIAMPYDPPNRVLELTKKRALPYPIALDIEGFASKAFGNIDVTPTSFLIDSFGNIIQQKTGEMDLEQLRVKIKKLLQTPPTTIS